MLIYCCNDLIFSTRIGSTAQSMGAPARPARNAEMLAKRLDQVEDGKLNEPVTGVFVDMDLGDTALELIEQTKSHSPGVPVVAFGAHVAVELLEQARQRGADHVMARGGFTQQLPELIKRFCGAEV